MKKKKQKSVIKAQKKAIKKDLKAQVVSALSTVTLSFGENKKTQKIIEKSAKQLAEKLSRFANPVHVDLAPLPAQELPLPAAPPLSAEPKS